MKDFIWIAGPLAVGLAFGVALITGMGLVESRTQTPLIARCHARGLGAVTPTGVGVLCVDMKTGAVHLPLVELTP